MKGDILQSLHGGMGMNQMPMRMPFDQNPLNNPMFPQIGNLMGGMVNHGHLQKPNFESIKNTLGPGPIQPPIDNGPMRPDVIKKGWSKSPAKGGIPPGVGLNQSNSFFNRERSVPFSGFKTKV